jgi:hypothetical protein
VTDIPRLVGRKSARLYLAIEAVVKEHLTGVHPNERFETAVVALVTVLMLHVIRHLGATLGRVPTGQEMLDYLDRMPFRSVATQVLAQLQERRVKASRPLPFRKGEGSGPH